MTVFKYIILICSLTPTCLFSYQIVLSDDTNPSFSATVTSVAGINNAVSTMSYRHSNSNQYSTIKMPGIAKYGNLKLYGVTFTNCSAYWSFESEIKMNTIQRTTYTLHISDQAGDSVRYKLYNAWPTYISTSTNSLSSSGSCEINQMNIAHEQMVVISN